MTATGGHQPVLAKEAVTGLAARPGAHFIDGTLGGGGHLRQLLAATAPDGRVLAIDWDVAAIRRVQAGLASDAAASQRITFVHGNFKNLAAIARQHRFTPTGGCLLDLGVSSHQLDDAKAGFGFTAERLDLRFDTLQPIPTAADLLRQRSARELESLFSDYGEEPCAREIAREIVRGRNREPIERAPQLVALVAEIYRRRFHRPSRRNPATRVFQALRIAVNHEFENLHGALRGALEILPPGARIAVISFHSLEDRIVKQFFRDESRGCRCDSDVPVCVCRHQPTLDVVTAKPIRPTPPEVASNPRSRSAKLRIAVRLAAPVGSTIISDHNKQ